MLMNYQKRAMDRITAAIQEVISSDPDLRADLLLNAGCVYHVRAVLNVADPAVAMVETYIDPSDGDIALTVVLRVRR